MGDTINVDLPVIAKAILNAPYFADFSPMLSLLTSGLSS